MSDEGQQNIGSGGKGTKRDVSTFEEEDLQLDANLSANKGSGVGVEPKSSLSNKPPKAKKLKSRPRRTKPLGTYTFRFKPQNFTFEECALALKDRKAVGPMRPDPMAMRLEKLSGIESITECINQNFVIPLKALQFFNDTGLKAGSGILLFGPSGCGKTAVAQSIRTLCSEMSTRVAFFAPKICEICRPEDNGLAVLFSEARMLAPSVVCIENVELFTGRSVPSGALLSSSLLTELSGLEDRNLVWVVGCTNNISGIESCFRKPGRFSVELKLGYPEIEARRQILTNVTRLWFGMTPYILTYVTDNTAGLSGEDLVEICKRAALIALQRSHPQLSRINDAYAGQFHPIHLMESDFRAVVSKYSRQ